MLKKIMFVVIMSVVSAYAAPIDDLAKTLYHEARGEGETGIRAVASIIVNRAKKDGAVTPVALSKVVRQKYQFSCWNGQTNLKTGKGQSWLVCRMVAGEMVNGQFKSVHNYTHYYAFRNCNPKWAKGKSKMVIGNHAFLNP